METAFVLRHCQGQLQISLSHTHTHTHTLNTLNTHSHSQVYLAQYHGGQSERDFVVTVVREGHEGEDYWKWFELQVEHNTHTGTYSYVSFLQKLLFVLEVCIRLITYVLVVSVYFNVCVCFTMCSVSLLLAEMF